MSITLYELVGEDAARPFSPHCWKVRMALRHKGLDFQTMPVSFVGIPEIENGLSRTLPVLRDGQHVVADSFRIAEYLETAYPEGPSLFGGEAGRRFARFIENWSFLTLHPVIGRIGLVEIHEMLDLPSRDYFRESREERFGATLEKVVENREDLVGPLLKSLQPVRTLLADQPYLGGAAPLFADFIVFGALQWLRIVSTFPLIPSDDPIAAWFERCLDLYDGEARAVPERLAS